MFDYKHSRGNGSASRLARFLLLFPQRDYNAGDRRRQQHSQTYLAANFERGDYAMRYAIAWILGVPFSIIVIWFLFSHLL
jgi:hypothetical protein